MRRASVGSNEAVYKGMRLAGLSETGRGSGGDIMVRGTTLQQ